MELNNESKTLFITMLGKAQMSEKNIFLNDKKAEEIIAKVDFDFKKLKQSKNYSFHIRYILFLQVFHIDGQLMLL